MRLGPRNRNVERIAVLPVHCAIRGFRNPRRMPMLIAFPAQRAFPRSFVRIGIHGKVAAAATLEDIKFSIAGFADPRAVVWLPVHLDALGVDVEIGACNRRPDHDGGSDREAQHSYSH